MEPAAFDTHLALVRRSGMHSVTVVEDTSCGTLVRAARRKRRAGGNEYYGGVAVPAMGA